MTFDITQYTDASLRMEATIQYQNCSADRVFEILGDPKLIPSWYVLAKEVHIHEAAPDGEAPFTVDFTFFGPVEEEILHWDPPHRYVYLAKGNGFPIKDYVASIEVSETSKLSGYMCWRIYCDQIEGEHYQRVLPIMLPAINKASMEKLSPLIGGVDCKVASFFDV